MLAITAENNIRAVACKHPLRSERVDYAFIEGMTVAQMLVVVDIPHAMPVIVHVGGCYVSPQEYAVIMPKKGELVAIRAVMQGGGGDGKNPLRTILMIVVVAVAAIVSGGLAASGGFWLGGTAVGVSSTGAALIGAGIMAVGSLIVNAIAPPPVAGLTANGVAQSYKDSPTYALSGARNAIASYGAIPMLLGRHRITPPMGALPYTLNSGNDQYLRAIFLLAKGQTITSAIKLGETPLSQFKDVSTQILDGTGATTRFDKFPRDVYEDSLSIALTKANSWQTRTSQPDAAYLAVDITFPQGLVEYADDGSRVSRNVAVEVQYSLVGSGVWSVGSSSGSYSAQNVSVTRLFGGKRNIAVVLNKATGVASIIYGELYSEAYTDTEGYYYPAVGSSAAVQIPSWAHGLAAGTQIHVQRTIWMRQDTKAYLAVVDIRSATIKAGGFLVTATNSELLNVASGTMTGPGFSVSGSSTSTIRKTLTISVAEGQYSVRLRRTTADTTSDRVMDKVWWSVLRTHQINRPILESYVSAIAVQVKASEQLNGMIDDLNCVATVVCPDYSSSTGTWITRPTTNPASLYRYVLQGPGNKRPLTDAQIDIGILEEWHTRCRLKKWTFGHYFDYRSNLDTVLQMIASAGRAAPGYVDGLYAVVMDKPQTNIVQHFTPRNTWGYKYSKTFVDLPHAFRVKFWNEKEGYREDERIVYDDGYTSANATKFEELSLPGITNGDLAWSHARYHIACARLRPEKHEFYADFESLTCTRGNLVAFQNDVIKVGLGTGRVKSAINDTETSTTIITVDEEFGMEDGKLYGIRVRGMDGTSTLHAVATVAGFSNELVIDTAYPMANLPEVGCLVMFGEYGQEMIRLIVKSIKPSGDLTAEITCVAEAPAVHTADTGTIPAFETNITTPADRWTLFMPTILQIRSDETVLFRNSTGSYSPRLVVSLTTGDTPGFLQDYINVVCWETGTDNPSVMVSASNNEAVFSGVEEGKTYSIKAQYIIGGKPAAWTSEVSHTVTGTTSVPPDVTVFGIAITGQQAFLSWGNVDVADLKQYVIKFQPVTTGATWADATELVRVSAGNTSKTVPAKTGTYLIKAVDAGGRESANAVLATSNTIEISEMNVVETITDGTGWVGTYTDTVKSGVAIELDAVDGVFYTTGYYELADVLDLGEVQTVRLSSTISAYGDNRTADFFAPADFFSPEDFFGTSEADWRVEMEVRTSADGSTYDDWRQLLVSDFNARSFKFRLKLISLKVGVTPVVSSASISADMPDRFISGNDIAVTTSGLTVAFYPAFFALKGVGINTQDMATGDYSTVTNKTKDGFNIIFKNAAGAPVSRTFDYIASGYGRRIT